MNFYGAASIPGDGCDTTAGHRSLKEIATHMNMAPLPEELMNALLDAPIPMSCMSKVSHLMMKAMNYGIEDGKQIGMEDVLDDPASFLQLEEDEP